MKLAPICLFTYNRISETVKVVDALRQNYLAQESILYIFSDGPKNVLDAKKVTEVRRFLSSITGFKKVILNESIENKGLSRSVILGVSAVIKQHCHAIVLEDDLVSSNNFLDFMNQGLKFYRGDKNIMSVCGYTWDMKSLRGTTEDVFFGCRSSSWGWATWQDRWDSVDWNVSGFQDFINDKELVRQFNRGGSDMTRMLKNQMDGTIDSWAIRFCFQQFIDNKASVIPTVSKIENIGFSNEATNTKGLKKFQVNKDNSGVIEFNFKHFEEYDNDLLKEFRKKFSILQRLYDRLRRFYPI